MNKQALTNVIRMAAFAAMAAIPGMCCSYSVAVPTIAAGGGPVPVYVYTQPGCSWRITHAAAWTSDYGVQYGTGTGAVYFYAAADRAAARSVQVHVVIGSDGGGTCIPGRSSGSCGGGTNVVATTTAVQY